MNIVIGDFEANGLLDTVDTIWCGVFREFQTNNYFIYDHYNGANLDLIKRFPILSMKELIERLNTYDKIVIHNGIKYDRELLKKVVNYSIPLNKIWDSLIWSNMLYPDIKTPESLPKKIEKHSLEAWGARIGIQKVPDLDWTKYDPEMLVRCKTDVDINHDMFQRFIWPEIKDEYL